MDIACTTRNIWSLASLTYQTKFTSTTEYDLLVHLITCSKNILPLNMLVDEIYKPENEP